MNVAQSSHLQRYDYEPNTEMLTVEFQNGTAYTYSGVPQLVYNNLVQNGGGGTYFWSAIRDRFPTTNVFDPRGTK